MAVATKKKAISGRFVGIRHFSWLNPFIDVCVFVPARYEAEAIRLLRAGMDDFWDFQFECYGDCIEKRFSDANIVHASLYIPWDHEGDDELIGEDGIDFETRLSNFGCPIYYT